MSSSTFAGNSESGGPGFCPAPPPPPPPPPVPGQAPALRINTVEAPVPRRSLPNNNSNSPYEPPAAIQNAMMTKDKKPFTYTPGMGGKLDLSQIRSPRMARRVAKNANDEGIEGPPKSSLAAEPRPVSTGPNLYVPPQVAVPVFPTNVPLQPSANRAPSAPASRVPSNASDRVAEVQRPVTRVEPKPAQVASPQPTPPETPTTPPQVTLAKAPTPWLQNKNKPQEELPEWAKRASVNRPSSSTSPESPNSQSGQTQINQAQPQAQQTIQLQQPPLTRQHQPAPPPRQQSLAQERVIPLRIEDRPSVFSVKHEPGHHQFKQQPQPSPHHQQRWGNSASPPTPVQPQSPQYPNQNQQPSRPQSSGGGTYIVPIMVEGSNGNNGPSAAPYNQAQQTQARSQPVQNQSPRVIVQRGPPSPQIQQQGEPGPLQSRSFRVLQKITDTDAPDEVDCEQIRKLQLTEDDKVLMNKFKEQGRQWVDLCADREMPGWQQPADREGSFDHTFVVDGDGTYLHQEEDPRYRGAAIPSRAFRYLQNMTDSGDVTATANAPRAPSAINKRQNRNSRTFEESQANLPASEQQAPEPKKYTGSAIPSRSFRILQAMTAPESIAKQENRQAVVTCQTENSMRAVNQQQTIFLSSPSSYDSPSEPLAPSQSQSCPSQSQPQQLQPLPPPFWQYPEGSCWWGYYPVHYTSAATSRAGSSSSPLQLSSTRANNPHNIPSYESYAYCTGCHHHHHHHHHPLQDGNAFAYYHPFYDQRLYAAAAISSPNGFSSSSSSSSSFSSDTAAAAAAAVAAAAVRRCTDVPSSSSNEEALAVVSSNELPPDDTGVPSSSSSSSSSFSSSSSSSSVSSRFVAARQPSTILHPASPACFVPAYIHHQPTSESPGYDSNCNPCLERTAAGAGASIFRCPPMFAPSSVSPAGGYAGSGGRNVWPCQDPAVTEPGPPPWRLNCQRAACVDSQTEEIAGNSGVVQREETMIRKEDDVEALERSGAAFSAKRVDVVAPKWSRNRLEEDAERSGRNVKTNVVDQIASPKNSKDKTVNAETNAADPAMPSWIRKNLEGNEDDVERSGRHTAPSPVNKLDVSTPKWSRNRTEVNEDESRKSGRNSEADLIDRIVTIEDTKWKTINTETNAVRERAVKKPIWARKNGEEKEIDAEGSGRSAASTSINKLDVSTPKWNRNHHEGTDDDAKNSRKIIDLGSTDQEAKIPQPRWNRIDSASRNLNEHEASIPMNILHEESNADTSAFSTANINEASSSLGEDHYSEDGNGTDSDSESELTSIESSVDAEPACTDPITNTDEVSDSETDSDDSDSYLAYSTGLNPHNKLTKEANSSVTLNHTDKEFRKSQTATTIDEDAFDERSFAMSSDRLNSTDCESCAEEDEPAEEETEAGRANCGDNAKADDVANHRLSVIPEDGEQSKIGSDGWQDVPEEPPDDSATVSVNLPLRFRFSVTENEQDVTTVIVGDTTVKAEEIPQSDDSNDVSINLKIHEDTNTSVEFTLRRTVSEEANDDDFDFWATRNTSDCKTPNENFNSKGIDEDDAKEASKVDEEEKCNDDDCIDFWETLKTGDESPDFNFNSRSAKNRVEKLSLCEDASEEENSKSEVKKEEKLGEEKVVAISEDLNCLEENSEDEEEEANEGKEDEEEGLKEEKAQILEDKKEEVSLTKTSAPLFELTEAKVEDNDEEETTSARSNVENSKHLLSVQNSRDETDDEDSGVTSDMSRLISEVDTDSECGPTRKINSYKRTQTHSRLFRLLSREDDEEAKNFSSRRDRLSLPLKNSYDESHHCSNYSSGLTSPDYSPVQEGSWRRMSGDENSLQPSTPEKSRSPAGPAHDEDISRNRKDPYFETWKKSVAEDTIKEEKTISSPGTIRISSNGGAGCGLPSWRFRTNVLCPRIKSTKNVPRTVRHSRAAKPVFCSPSTSKPVVATSERC